MNESKSHLILLGGFLGAGKTTAAARLAHAFADLGLRAAVITNDQGATLVDTVLVRAAGVSATEVGGGCFCCRFDALVAARGRLITGEPVDVFIAEAVGSCTDLMATVVAPMRRLHGDATTVGPLSVLVDAARARRVLGLDPGGSGFSADVDYIYRKQIEEADVVVLNKADLLAPAALEELHGALARLAPHATLHVMSLRHEPPPGAWMHEVLFGCSRHRPVMDVDYDRYAEGEARLGWLNASVDVTSDAPFDPDDLVLHLAGQVQADLAAARVSLAHLKLTLQEPRGAGGAVSAAQVVRGDAFPEPTLRIGRLVTAGTVLVNLRAEGAPAMLAEVWQRACARLAILIPGASTDHPRHECFRPGRPRPTHRDVDLPVMAENARD